MLVEHGGDESRTAASYSESGLIQLVWTLASRVAFSMYVLHASAKRVMRRAGRRRERPNAHQGLIEEVLVVAAGGRLAVHLAAVPPI